MDDESKRLLQQHGLQVTAQRMATLRAVAARPHATADEVAHAVRASIGAVSRQAVYDTLAVLVEKQLVRRIQTPGSAARYEDRVGDNHHHVICRACGATSDVDCAVGATPCLAAQDAHGFEIDEAEVIYWGRCPACRDAAAAGRANDETPARPEGVSPHPHADDPHRHDSDQAVVPTASDRD